MALMKHLLVFTLLLALLSSSVLSKKGGGRGGIFGGSKSSKKTSSSSSSKSSWSSWSSNSNTQGGGNAQSRPNWDNPDSPYRSGAGGPNWGQNNNRMPNQQGYGYGHNQPGYGHNQPGYGHNQPGYGHNQPGYGYGHNQPGYGYGHNQPGYGYGHNQPGYGYGHNQPGYGYGHNQPGYGWGSNPGYGQGYGKNYGYKPKGFGKNSMVAAGVGAAAGAAVGYGLGRMYSRPWMDIDFDSPDAAKYYNYYMARRYGRHHNMYRDDDGYNYYYERPAISYNDFIESCMQKPNLLEMPKNCSEPDSPDCVMERDYSDSALVELFLNKNVSTDNTTSTGSNITTTTTTSTTPQPSPSMPTSSAVLRDTIQAKAATSPELATQMKLARCSEEYVDYTHQYLVPVPQSRATSIKMMNALIFLASILMLQGFF